jgi:hypothetical protein
LQLLLLQSDDEDEGPTEEQIAVYRPTFQMFDKDGGGTISIQELTDVIKNVGITFNYFFRLFPIGLNFVFFSSLFYQAHILL